MQHKTPRLNISLYTRVAPGGSRYKFQYLRIKTSLFNCTYTSCEIRINISILCNNEYDVSKQISFFNLNKLVQPPDNMNNGKFRNKRIVYLSF